MATEPASTNPMDRRTVRVDSATWREFTEACERDGTTASKALREFMRRHARRKRTTTT